MGNGGANPCGFVLIHPEYHCFSMIRSPHSKEIRRISTFISHSQFPIPHFSKHQFMNDRTTKNHYNTNYCIHKGLGRSICVILSIRDDFSPEASWINASKRIILADNTASVSFTKMAFCVTIYYRYIPVVTDECMAHMKTPQGCLFDASG